MKIHQFLSLLGLLALSLVAPGDASAATTVQRQCSFTYVIKLTDTGVTKSRDVNWTVTLARKGRAGRVVVKGSGDYKARASSFASGAQEYGFETQVSNETITVGANGDALWQIDFKNGDFMAYAGSCQPQRVTSESPNCSTPSSP